VSVKDSRDNPVEGASVTWSTSGVGHFVASESSTDANGEAHAVVTSDTAGDQTIGAATTCAGCSDSSTFHWGAPTQQKAPRVKIAVTAHKPRPGTKVGFQTRLAACSDPAAAAELTGTQIILERQKGSSFIEVGRKKLNQHCRALLHHRARTGAYRFEWPKQAPDFRSGHSQAVTITVR
jgi:Big-like domain-containing protein